MGSAPQSPEPQSPEPHKPGTQQPEPQKAEPQKGVPRSDQAVPDVVAPTADYVDGVPTFDFVRDRIEGRVATALGTTELSEETAAGRSLAQQEEERDAAARERLEEIRRSLREK